MGSFISVSYYYQPFEENEFDTIELVLFIFTDQSFLKAQLLTV